MCSWQYVLKSSRNFDFSALNKLSISKETCISKLTGSLALCSSILLWGEQLWGLGSQACKSSGIASAFWLSSAGFYASGSGAPYLLALAERPPDLDPDNDFIRKSGATAFRKDPDFFCSSSSTSPRLVRNGSEFLEVSDFCDVRDFWEVFDLLDGPDLWDWASVFPRKLKSWSVGAGVSPLAPLKIK